MKIIRTLNGYRFLYIPDHPKAMKSDNWIGYVYEHIVVAEKSIGRELKDSEVVHHLNGNRSDNRSFNLIVLERSQHTKLHVWIDKGSPYEGKIYEGFVDSDNENTHLCQVCGNTIHSKLNELYCSNKCKSFSQRVVERPSKEALIDDISKSNFAELARKYGVADNTVRKWAKRYQII